MSDVSGIRYFTRLYQLLAAVGIDNMVYRDNAVGISLLSGMQTS